MSKKVVNLRSGEFFDEGLRVVQCAECERLRGFLQELQADLDQAEIALRSERRKVASLKAKASEERKKHPNYETARKLFEFWAEACGHPRAVFDDDRERAIIKALDHYTPRQLAYAILGAKYDPHVGDNGVTHDGIELIVRNADKTESFIARYAAYRQRQGLPPLEASE